MNVADGKLDKLKVEECKNYLRKYGLRLTGNKNVLQARVKEHLEVMDGGGEKKYPVSSFILNCKVAGRIVKESYGAAKQQHTFTGRNLYRLKTMRQYTYPHPQFQRWDDEEERNRVLQEKHRRGGIARYSREVRIREKEKKNMTGGKRPQALASKNNVATGAQNTRHQPLISQKSIATATHNTQHQAVASEKSTVAGAQNTWPQALVSENSFPAGAQNILHQALVTDMLTASGSQNTRHQGPVSMKPSAAAGLSNNAVHHQGDPNISETTLFNATPVVGICKGGAGMEITADTCIRPQARICEKLWIPT
ncbi:hypothetical protein Taro_038311 [Colocasia esculenta]|uniref:SAP domain-containing protein n=1 Tax=Colocasia esculenta TaxID=4460 RepID=A0A843W6C3_COLES|nr:hypothetical protein [Colocasia esculenta]